MILLIIKIDLYLRTKEVIDKSSVDVNFWKKRHYKSNCEQKKKHVIIDRGIRLTRWDIQRWPNVLSNIGWSDRWAVDNRQCWIPREHWSESVASSSDSNQHNLKANCTNKFNVHASRQICCHCGSHFTCLLLQFAIIDNFTRSIVEFSFALCILSQLRTSWFHYLHHS